MSIESKRQEVESNPFTIYGYEGFIIFGVYFASMQALPLTRKPLFLILAFLGLALVAASIAGRDYMLKRMLSKASLKAARHGYQLAITKAAIKGISTISAERILLKRTTGKDSIILDTFRLRIQPLPLFAGIVRISSLDCKRISVNYTFERRDSIVVLPNESKASRRSLSDMFGNFTEICLSDCLNRQIDRFFSYIPEQLKISHVNAAFHFKTAWDSLVMNDILFEDGQIQTTALMYNPEDSSSLDVVATFRPHAQLFGFDISTRNGNTLASACLKDILGLEVSFDTLAFHARVIHQDSKLIRISGDQTIRRMVIQSDLLAAEPVSVEYVHSDFTWQVGDDFFEVDSNTHMILNRIKLNPYLRIDLNRGPLVQFSFRPVEWEADVFFSSLPRGMFSSLIGMKASGKLRFSLHAAIDLENPDSLAFITRLDAEDFRILEYGADDYRILNEAFPHQVYEDGVVQKSFVVGPGNKDFVPIGQISHFLQSAVLTSEDGRFYSHRGFNAEAIRESLAANLREMRFVRGGSTISMQLVKNVFLTRKKTLARKIEEALIVWLIENHRLASKDRMFEVYLNIIEWGPAVYGIQQAAQFYFKKNAQELNLQESIFLASIIPHPKWFAYTFNPEGQTRPFFSSYLDRMKSLMVDKGWVTASDTAGIGAAIRLLGPASGYLNRSDSLVEDPLMLREMELMVPRNMDRIWVNDGE